MLFAGLLERMPEGSPLKRMTRVRFYWDISISLTAAGVDEEDWDNY